MSNLPPDYVLKLVMPHAVSYLIVSAVVVYTQVLAQFLVQALENASGLQALYMDSPHWANLPLLRQICSLIAL